MNRSEIVSFLWGVPDLIRDTLKRGKYQDVILPLTVLRRLDGVLADTKESVLKRQAQTKGAQTKWVSTSRWKRCANRGATVGSPCPSWTAPRAPAGWSG